MLYVLRPEDLCIDVGANIGSCTILTVKAIGAHCITIELIPSTFAHLIDNLQLNYIQDNVCALNVGVSQVNVVLSFISDSDTTNRVALTDNKVVIDVQVKTLDDIIVVRKPTLIMVNVEGYESEVIAGGQKSLRRPDLICIIIEINGRGSRYNHEDEEIMAIMSEIGFETYPYLPFKRSWIKINEFTSGGNVLFLKRENFAQERVKSASSFSVNWREVYVTWR